MTWLFKSHAKRLLMKLSDCGTKTNSSSKAVVNCPLRPSHSLVIQITLTRGQTWCPPVIIQNLHLSESLPSKDHQCITAVEQTSVMYRIRSVRVCSIQLPQSETTQMLPQLNSIWIQWPYHKPMDRQENQTDQLRIAQTVPILEKLMDRNSTQSRHETADKDQFRAEKTSVRWLM